MSFGKRRFQSLVLTDGQMHAYFLPLDDLTKPAEYVTEETLRAVMASAGAVQHTHGEEFLALKAFDQFLRGKKGSRATAEAAVARRGQESIVDPLQPHERALVERWRKLVTLGALPKTVGALSGTSGTSSDTALDSSRHDFFDTATDVMKLLDLYLPKGTQPALDTKGP